MDPHLVEPESAVMIRHIVLIRFAPDLAAGEQESILTDLARLEHVVPGTIAFSGGPNVSPEPLSKGYTHAFTFDFESAAARDAYLVHPDHRAAGARLVQAVAGRIEGLIVIDIAF